MADEDGFQMVRRGKGRKNRNFRGEIDISANPWSTHVSSEREKCDLKEVRTKIEKCREELSASEFFASVRELLCGSPVSRSSDSQNLETPKTLGILREPPVDIVCYGIGNIASCPTGRYQFGLLLLLIELLQIAGQCFIYEPHFSQHDNALVEEFGCSIIAHNEEGKRKVERPTLFFMLHCGKPLYNSVLWANWGIGLSNVVILGNRFSSYQERLPSRKLMKEAPYINNILPYVVESAIPNTFYLTDIFNDSAIHWFPVELLLKVPNIVWADNEEPKYGDSDPEIVIHSVHS